MSLYSRLFIVKNNNPYGSGGEESEVYPLGKAEHHVSVNR